MCCQGRMLRRVRRTPYFYWVGGGSFEGLGTGDGFWETERERALSCVAGPHVLLLPPPGSSRGATLRRAAGEARSKEGSNFCPRGRGYPQHGFLSPFCFPSQRPFKSVIANGSCTEPETHFRVLWHYGKVFLRASNGRYLGTLPVGLVVARAMQPGEESRWFLQPSARCAAPHQHPWLWGGVATSGESGQSGGPASYPSVCMCGWGVGARGLWETSL